MTPASSALESLVLPPRITGLASDASGRVVAAVSALTSTGDAFATTVHRIDTDVPEQLTQGTLEGWALAPGGGVLLARAGDDQEGGLWLLPRAGEARRLATWPGGFDDVQVAGARVVVTVGRLPSTRSAAEHRELAAAREEAGTTAVLHESFPTRYWDDERGPEADAVLLGDLPGAEHPHAAPAPGGEDRLSLTSLPLPPGRLDTVVVSDDGASILCTVVGVEGTLERRGVWRLRSEGPEPLAMGTPTHEFSALAISPDGTRVIVGEERAWTREATMSVRLLVLDLASGEITPLFPEAPAWLTPIWLDDDTVAATSDFRGRGAVWVGSVGDAAPRLLAGGEGQSWHFTDLARSGGGLAALRAAVDAPPEPVRIDPTTGEVTALANPVAPIPRAGTLTEVHARGADGAAIRAWLALPDSPGPHPLLVFVHGGPWGSWNTWTWRWNPWVFANEGYAVLLPDPAISTGYGDAMIERGQQELGGAPYTDVLALTDAAIAREDIDAEHTALAGGSYGGYLTNWIAGHTGRRFRCLVSHASIWDLASMTETTDSGTWEEALRSQLGTYSPRDFADAIEVPMLVTHGDKDYRVPIGQAQQLWFHLQQRSPHLGHKFLSFPDEGHWIRRPGNVKAWYQTLGAFFDAHVRGQGFVRPRLLG